MWNQAVDSYDPDVRIIEIMASRMNCLITVFLWMA